MQKVKLTDNVTVSRLIHGLWRLPDWNLSTNELGVLIEQCLDNGVTTFDHADIYGAHTCEELFGNALANNNIQRHKIQLISKCGIKLVLDKYPATSIKHYDYSLEHIIESVENSLKNLKTDYLDILLLHRPSPFINPEIIAQAFSQLKKQGKVLQFGVSNFTPQQYRTLDSFLEDKLVTNQVEISPLCLDHFENENIDFFLEKKISPMAWSPLAGGKLFNPKTPKELRLNNCLTQIANELGIENIDQIMYAWLLKHPSNIIPIIGSGKIDRIKSAIDAQKINLNAEQWFSIYTSGTGNDVA